MVGGPVKLLEGNVLWAYDKELADKRISTRFAGLFSFVNPIHNHQGMIYLTEYEISIIGDESIKLPLASINEVYLGFDNLFQATTVKNLGLFWQPLRIEYFISSMELAKIYLVIDYNGFVTENKLWFNTLQQLLS